MNLPLFIARKTAQSTTSTQSTMVHIATAAVAVSIAVMVITVAVVAGFRKELTASIRDISADITVTDSSSLYGAEVHPISQSDNLLQLLQTEAQCESILPYAMCGCIIRSQSAAAGIVIKGVTEIDNKGTIAKSLLSGALPRIEQTRHKELLLPEDIAQRLQVEAQDRVELLIRQSEGLPRRELFKVAGIYKDWGATPIELALTDIRNVQRLNGWDYNTLSGFEMRLTDPENATIAAAQINNALFERYEGTENISAVEAQRLYSSIFAWIDTHNVNAAVIIAIMFIVALFNMITALLILVFERTRMVGILKSLGMDNRAIRRIFLYQAAKIVCTGLAIGNGFAIVLILLQRFTGILKLDAAAYFVDHVPVSIGVADIAVINLLFAAAILALLFASTAIVSRIKPSEAVKYE